MQTVPGLFIRTETQVALNSFSIHYSSFPPIFDSVHVLLSEVVFNRQKIMTKQ